MCHYLGGGLHGRKKRVKAQSESSKSVVNSVLISREMPVFPGFLEIIRVVGIIIKQRHRDFMDHSDHITKLFETEEFSTSFEHIADVIKEKVNYPHYELTDFFDVINAYSDREKVNTFLCSFIEKHHSDSVYMRSLFDSIAKMTDEQRIAYIKLYLEYEKSIENFKDLPLFSSFSSWSGSEVPLIHNKIEFLNRLSQEIHGIDYLEHKQHIGKMINDLNSYAKDVEIREILRGY